MGNFQTGSAGFLRIPNSVSTVNCRGKKLISLRCKLWIRKLYKINSALKLKALY